MRMRSVVAGIGSLGLMMTARAQCTPQWYPPPVTVPTIANGPIMSATTWDPDGSGPLPEKIVMIANGRVCTWDGTTFTVISETPIPRNPRDAIAVYNNEIYVAGWFTSLNGVSAQGIAKWNGSNWQAVGSATGQASFLSLNPSLKVYKGELYMSGGFTTAGGAPSNCIARWNGTQWNGLAGTAFTPISGALDMQIVGDDLWIGGEIAAIPGVAGSRSAAKWNGTSWTGASFPYGSASYVRSIGDFNGTPWMFGAFYDPTNTVLIGGIIRKTLAGWEVVPGGAVSGGPVATVTSFKMYQGKLAVGGLYLNAGPIINANDIALHDGTSWYRMLQGIQFAQFNHYVSTMLVYRGELHCFGLFNQVNGVPQFNWARWFDGPPVIVTQPTPQQICTGNTSKTLTIATGGVNTLQWRKNAVPLINGATGTGSTISGVNAESLVISNISPLDEGMYDCVLVNTCGTRTTDAVHVFECVGDLNCDHYVDDADFVEFANAYNLLLCDDPLMPAFCPSDFNDDGFVDDADFVTFATGYNTLLCE